MTVILGGITLIPTLELLIVLVIAPTVGNAFQVNKLFTLNNTLTKHFQLVLDE